MESRSRDGEELLELAFDDPELARMRASRIVVEAPDLLAISFAHQCLGIVLREEGRTDEALAELRLGLKAARGCLVPDRERDVRATYAGTLAYAGRTRDGLKQFERALDGASGELAATILMRKAGVLSLNRPAEAVPVMRQALRKVMRVGNPTWEARTRIWLADLEQRRGRLDAAEREIVAAERLFRGAGRTIEPLDAKANLAAIAVARGDLARGLRHYASVLEDYASVGVRPPSQLISLYGSALLAAGLAEDAVRNLDDHLVDAQLPEVEKAEFHLLRAAAHEACGDFAAALAEARVAAALFRRQHRDWYVIRARLVAVRAEYAKGERHGIAAEARRVAEALAQDGADEAPLALDLAGRVASEGTRRRLWAMAATYRRRPNGLVRASAWLVGANERSANGERSGVLKACAAGLAAVDDYRRTMGSSELRALATTHGRELTTIALRHAAHDPRTLLRWSERTRATALAQPPATSDAATIPASLAALRDNGRQLAEARQAGEPTEQLEKERLRLERAVRAEHHTLAPGTEEAQRPASAEEVVAGVGDGCLLELVDVDGVLHVLMVHNGRVRRRTAGTTAEIADLLGPTAMLMRRASRGRPASMDDLARHLQEAALGEAAQLIPDGPVVLSPTARLHGVPWALLPVLADRPFSVVPSAGQWLRAKAVRRPRARRTALVAGPGLASGGAEVPQLAERYADAVLLAGSDATVEVALRSIDGADLVHLAAHGRFRADSPLFSALELADGPLVVHDLERLKRAPYRVVLSACESGVLAPVGAEEVLGLAAALISLGTSGLVCSVADVNDDATARLMVRLHAELAAGSDPATALHATRAAMADDPVAATTAAAFVALGA